jgi:hypothetical protein
MKGIIESQLCYTGEENATFLSDAFLELDFSSWQPRRMLFTRQVLVFSKSTDEEVLDVIKLHEVRGIKDNSGRDQTGQINLAPEYENSKLSNTKSENARKTFQIETTEEGYNAGRIYTIQMKSDKDFEATVMDLTRLCRKARDKAEARSKFKQIQDKVSKVFDSNMVQGFFSFLIFAVNEYSSLIVFLFLCFDVAMLRLTEFRSECFRSTSQHTETTRRLIEWLACLVRETEPRIYDHNDRRAVRECVCSLV